MPIKAGDDLSNINCKFQAEIHHFAIFFAFYLLYCDHLAIWTSV